MKKTKGKLNLKPFGIHDNQNDTVTVIQEKKAKVLKNIADKINMRNTVKDLYEEQDALWTEIEGLKQKYHHAPTPELKEEIEAKEFRYEVLDKEVDRKLGI